ncbi:hypothetical protein DPM19_07150 [Actinomadura craniellae]|uniref:Uncharacterized protein n=1 Tax=Actinomadura craniellae TaxID=2231787 RepID=A0A365H8Y8_9ACTN|nr:hypothetical protein [Actinomadura craniellae]RAY15565.1 hypothetical protein DPM19_07150 [Actinomadura craniellae]
MTYIVVLLCLAIAGRELYLAFDRRLPNTQADLRALRGEVRGLDERVGELYTRLAGGREADPAPLADRPDTGDRIDELADRVAQLESSDGAETAQRITRLSARLTALELAAEPSGGPPNTRALDALTELTTRLTALEAAAADGTGLAARVAALESAAGAPTAPEARDEQTAELADRVAALEARNTFAEAEAARVAALEAGGPGEHADELIARIAALEAKSRTEDTSELAARVAALEARGGVEGAGGLVERVDVLERDQESVPALARSLDTVESTMNGLRRELFDRLDQADDTVHGLLLGDDPVDEPLLAAAYERCLKEAGLRVRLREEALDDRPWHTVYHLSGRPPAEVARELLVAARESGPDSALGALLATLGEQRAGIARIGPFTAARTGRTLTCGVLDDTPVHDPESAATRIAELPMVARADLYHLLG